ncbi:MAG TPA: glycerol-3-phosphate dehydrogenase/oxidase [Terriglobales bacterium]|nr:glycerol-3-phosphate dehydrogenase/oxidase [Terriglobales bacterium]
MNSRPTLEGQHFDVLVMGGGINGVAIARECARAGRRTLLVEQQDFASGTTSRSTRIIHGGLRYLEQGDIAQVRESLRERRRLVQQYPHLVHPLQFLLALDDSSRRSVLAVRAGLWLYRRMGGARLTVDGHEQQIRLERLLDAGRRFNVFSFEDAQCEFPERLVAEWLVEAVRAGCQARNHTRVLAIRTSNGRATGALLRDELNGLEERVDAAWIINATGPWADQICQTSGIHTTRAMVGGVRGSHIVLPKFAGAPEAAVYTEAVDGRPIFVIPWNEQILLGTTEIPDDRDPTGVRPSNEEIQYLLRSLHRLFPRIGISGDDIRYAFAGVRPLPYSPQSSPLALTRRHFFHDHGPDGAAGMISLIGGKLTTAGAAARECSTKLGIAPSRIPTVAVAAEVDVHGVAEHAINQVAEIAGVSPESANGMVAWYGPRSLHIAHRARSNPQLRQPLCPHTDHIVAEAVDAFENQYAVTLGDVLLRRVPVALGACWSTECGCLAASRIGAAMGWNDSRRGAALEQFEAECDAFLQRTTTSQTGRGFSD